MSKNNKRLKFCIYCGRAATTRDHVPPRCLLNSPYPNNLITLPCCRDCNNGFSKDEEYLICLLATLGDSPTLLEKQTVDGSIERAILRNSSLYDRIINTLSVDEENRAYLTPETERIKRVVIKIASGIYFKRYKHLRPTTDFICLRTFHDFDQIPMQLNAILHTARFIPKKWTIVQQDVFSYIIVRNSQNNTLLLLINFHNTLLSCVEMKLPVARRVTSNIKNSTQGVLFADY